MAEEKKIGNEEIEPAEVIEAKGTIETSEFDETAKENETTEPVKTAEANETTETMDSAESVETAENEKSESEQRSASGLKGKRGILCLLAFWISLATLVTPIIITIILVIAGNSWLVALTKVMVNGVIPCSASLTVALILSIIGLIIAFVKKKRGKVYGFISLFLSWPGPIGLIGCVLILALLKYLAGQISFSPTFFYPHYDGPIILSDNYHVQISDNTGEDLSEGAALKYFWSGDPDDTEIRPVSVNNGETKITSIGYISESSSGTSHKHNFSIDLPDEKKYCDISMENDYAVLDPKYHLDDYGIEPGTRVIFDEIEFRVFIDSDIEHVCISFTPNLTPTPMTDPNPPIQERRVSPNYLVMKNDDGSITFYRYHLSFECSQDNKRFYVDEDGTLCVETEKDGSVAIVARELYKNYDDFEPFEMIYEGETNSSVEE